MTVLFPDRSHIEVPAGSAADRERIAALEYENRKLKRINKVLMDRVERSMDFQGGAFSLFQTAIVLEQKVRERTLELERALRELETSHRDLARAKEMADTMRTRLSEAIESVNEGFAIFDGDDRLVLCNSKYLALWPEIRDRIVPGVRFREIAELAASSRSVADAYPRPDLWLSQRLAQHRELKGPYIYRLADGRWIQVNERRTRDGGVVGIYTDITDIKEHETRRRERELAEKSALLQATLDNIAQGVAVYDRDQRLVAWNERFAALLRLPETVARRGASFADFVLHQAALGQHGLSLGALMMPSCLVEQPWVDGTVLEISRNPMPSGRTGAGSSGGFVMTFTDITERKRAEQALRDSEQRIRLVTDAMPALIAYVDAEQRFQFVNKAYETYFNRTREEIEGQPMWVALGETHYERRKSYALRALAGEEVTFELELPDDNGAPRYALATYIPHFGAPNGGGKPAVIGYFGLIHDITERRLVAEALRDAKDSLERRVAERTAELTRLNGQLQQEIAERVAAEKALRLAKVDAEHANLSKTKFLAAASHDLLQPLNAARLFVSALSDLEQPPANRGMVENIDVALASVEDLLSALLDISKLDAGAVTPEIADFPIKSLFGALATEYAAVARERGLELRVVSSHAVVRSDIRLLRRILQNFLSNALRYTQTGRVLVGCRRTAAGLRIEVWDTGPGVPADKVGEIFEEFRRLDTPAGKDRVRGMGLGLAIVDRVARMLDHPVTVRSAPGRGSVFAVVVPYGTYARPPRVLEAPARVATNRLAGTSVLVIDNEPAVLAGMRALLEGWGCAVATATSGDEALAGLGAAPDVLPDVLIADYHLDNGVIGLTEIERVRRHCGHAVPAVLITANRTAEVIEEAQALSCQILNKPVRPAQLRALMTGILG